MHFNPHVLTNVLNYYLAVKNFINEFHFNFTARRYTDERSI